MTSSFIGKSVVDTAKKAIPMAGQKLSDFFAKEGVKKVTQQAGNIGKQVGQYAKSTGKELYQRRGELASALGDDLTAVGKGVMKGPETIKAGARFVGDVASDATARVGKEAVRAGIRAGGKAGGQGVKNIGTMASSPFALQTGIGVAAEQIIPRVMGQEPRSGLGESILRQGVSQGVGLPVSAGLMAGGINPAIATFGGQVAGQIAGQKATDMLLPGKQDYPVEFGEYNDLEDRGIDAALGKPGVKFSAQDDQRLTDLDRQLFGAGPKTPTGATKHTAEPESAQVVRPSTTDLSGVQAREALSERDKYEYRLKMAQIEKMPSTVMHMSPDSNNQTLASLAQSMMRSTSY